MFVEMEIIYTYLLRWRLDYDKQKKHHRLDILKVNRSYRGQNHILLLKATNYTQILAKKSQSNIKRIKQLSLKFNKKE